MFAEVQWAFFSLQRASLPLLLFILQCFAVCCSTMMHAPLCLISSHHYILSSFQCHLTYYNDLSLEHVA
ncbi:hypothetical protein Peur_010153 [Populus x canadensis]